MKIEKIRPRLAGEDFPFWHFPISRPHAGIKLGTPQVGLLVWGGGRDLHLSIGLTSFWDHRGGAEWHEEQSYSNIRRMLETNDVEGMKQAFLNRRTQSPQLLPFGRLSLRLPPGSRLDLARLDILKGRLTVTTAGAAAGSLDIAVDWPTGALVVVLGRELAATAVTATAAIHQADNARGFAARGIAAPTEFPNGFEQPLPDDPAAALAFARSGRAIFAAPMRGAPGAAFGAAEKQAAACAKLGAAALFRRTALRWKAFWSDVPKLDLPNATLQYIYDYGMYQFGAATGDEIGSTPAPLQGPWYSDHVLPPWGGDYHFNINLQEYYWPAFHGNRLEHLRPVFSMLHSWLPRLRANAKVFVGIDDGIMLPHAVDDHGTVMTATFWTGMMDHGSTMWMADLMWRYYELGGKGGRKFLRDEALPFMAGAFNVLWKMLDREKDGSLSLPVGPSPEYRGAEINAWGRNASFQLAASHRLAANLLAAADALRIAPDPRWSELRDRLPLAAVVDDAMTYGRQLGIWEGLVLEYSHRHHSHLAAIYPFDSIDLDDPDWHKVVANSLGQWLRFGMAYWSGWSLPWASLISTRVGNADAAEFLLEFWERFFVNEGRGTLHDCRVAGINLMGRDAIEEDVRDYRDIIQFDAAGAATNAVLEMLCHERAGVTRLFRGAPARWLDVSFDGIRSTGGVLVSASRRNGVVGPVKLIAAAGACTFRLANPWKGRPVEICRRGKKTASGDILAIPLAKGETAILRPASSR